MKDLSKTTAEEDMESQLNYMIKKGIFKQPSQVDNQTMEIGTDWFNSLSKTKQDEVLDSASNDWWKEYGEGWMNEIYNEEIMKDDNIGNINEWWEKLIKSNIRQWSQQLGITEYNAQIKMNRSYVNHINEQSLDEFIKEKKLDVSSEDLKKIKNALHNRRLQGGCGMWQNVGIPFLYKTNKDSLYPMEVDWYEKNKKPSKIDE